MTGVYRPAVLEWEQELRVPVFSPRLRATPIPEEDWNSGLIRCFHISDAWIPHILGVLDALDQPDTWIGTDAEIEDARQNVREIMVELSRGRECEEMPQTYIKGIGDCNEEGLLVTQVIDGVEGTARIDITACIPQVENYVQRIIECDLGIIEYEEIVNGSLEINSIDLNVCLDGRFVKPSELPEQIVPIPSLVGDNLWFDTNDDGIADLNVGNVRGATGATGASAPIPAWEIVGTDLYVDTNSDGIYDQNLGRVVGNDGIDGECETCAPVPAPEVIADETDGLMCSIAINEAQFLRGIWDKAFADTEGFINGYIGGLVTGASVIAYFFPGAAVAAGIAGLLLTLFKGINDLESNSFDDEAEERYRCMLYCILKDADEVNITDAIRSAWVSEIDADSLNPAALYVGDLLEYTPIEEFQWIAYASSEVNPDACLECDCGDDECEGGTFTVMANNSVLGETSFVTNASNWYTVEWTGTAVTQTTSPVQTFDGFYFTTNGTTWTLGQARMQYRKNGSYTSFPVPTRSTTQHYSFVFKGDGVEKISLRLADGSYGNNSGSWTITVTCHTTNPGGTVIQL